MSWKWFLRGKKGGLEVQFPTTREKVRRRKGVVVTKPGLKKGKGNVSSRISSCQWKCQLELFCFFKVFLYSNEWMHLGWFFFFLQKVVYYLQVSCEISTFFPSRCNVFSILRHKRIPFFPWRKGSKWAMITFMASPTGQGRRGRGEGKEREENKYIPKCKHRTALAHTTTRIRKKIPTSLFPYCGGGKWTKRLFFPVGLKIVVVVT